MQSGADLEADTLWDAFQYWYGRSDEHVFLVSQMSWEQKVIIPQRLEKGFPESARNHDKVRSFGIIKTNLRE